jgi:hypothetical protein
MDSRNREESRVRVATLTASLLKSGKLVLTPGAVVSRLVEAFNGDVTDHEALLDWLVAQPEVDELFVSHPELARAWLQTHPAAEDDAAERPAFCGMVVRGYEILRWIAREAADGRRFALLTLDAPLLFAQTWRTAEDAVNEESSDVAQADLDPLGLGEEGAAAVHPTEREMLKAVFAALERPRREPVRPLLRGARVELRIRCGDGRPIALNIAEPIDVDAFAHSVRRPS